MAVMTLPVTTYVTWKNKPNQVMGSPANIYTRYTIASIWLRVPIQNIPRDAVITSATLKLVTYSGWTASSTVLVRAATGSWNANITWNKRPTVGPTLDTVTLPAPSPKGTLVEFDVTSWAQTRDTRGLNISNTDVGQTFYTRFHGSSSSESRPVLEVAYSTDPVQPSKLVPNSDGGAVSVPSPILSYVGDDDMTLQQVQFSDDEGLTVLYESGWLPATEGRYDPAEDPGTPPVLSAGETIWWRVRDEEPEGTSPWSEWAEYTYQPLTPATITSPLATTDDGSPTLEWTVTDQQSWKADFYSGATLLESSGWRNEPNTRDWTPTRSVKVPGGQGRFVLSTRDSFVRVAAAGAPTHAEVTHDFTTVVNNTGTAVDSLVLAYDEPIPVLTGTRALGVPDKIGLFRDGVQVPLWLSDGTPMKWADAAEFFTGTTFELRDYTANPRASYTWQVKVKVGSTTYGAGPTVTGKVSTGSVWIVNPRTAEKVEVLGYNDLPAVEQTTEENSILHVPVNTGLRAEPKRRRLTRTTRSGSIEGTVMEADEGTLEEWVLGSSGLRYRLIFGKVNWSVIIGDYSPADTFYPDDCGPDRVLVSLNWWERLADY